MKRPGMHDGQSFVAKITIIAGNGIDFGKRF
jgi:hypothetical protein